ncbi:hypothetical protein D3C85_936440 [compost metagenome]
MANELAGVLTDLGAALIEQAYQAGEVVQITAMGLGDGGGADVVVSPDVTALIGEFHQQLLDGGPDEESALGGSINYVPLPEDLGKWLREFGLYDAAGNLIVYAAHPASQLPTNPNMAAQFIISIMVPVMNIEAVEIVINPEGTAAIDHTHTLTLSGDATGSAVLGPNSATLVVTVVDNSHAHTAAQGNADMLAEAPVYANAFPVGAYALLRNTSTTQRVAGKPLSGAELMGAAADGQTYSVTVPGTWRCQGFSESVTNADSLAHSTTLFIRIDTPAAFDGASFSGLAWTNEEKTSIDMQVHLASGGVMPFTASKCDVEAHGRWLFALGRANELGLITEYVPPTPLEVAARDNPKARQRELAHAIAQAQHHGMMGNGQLSQRWCDYYRQVYAMAAEPDWPMVSAWPARPE